MNVFYKTKFYIIICSRKGYLAILNQKSLICVGNVVQMMEIQKIRIYIDSQIHQADMLTKNSLLISI